MKTVVGVVFTDHPVLHLESLGFLLKKVDESEKLGYRGFVCHLSSNHGLKYNFEIREVLDEDLYYSFNKKNNFAPFIMDNTIFPEKVSHPNTVESVEEILNDSMAPSDLSHFLSIKKRHPLWALRLKCKDLSTFEKFAPHEMKIQWENKSAFVVHLGQSCFDLVVTN